MLSRHLSKRTTLTKHGLSSKRLLPASLSSTGAAESPEQETSAEETQEQLEAGDELTLSATALAETEDTTVDSPHNAEEGNLTSSPPINQHLADSQRTADSTNAQYRSEFCNDGN